MNDDNRPDPDALLAEMKRDEARVKQGRLFIFLGMCPGVGKTYAMLQAARQRGDHEVMLHAQRSAEGFYRKRGFTARGEPFTEAGIAHIEMAAPLPLVRR